MTNKILHWGNAIVLSFVLFISFIGFLSYKMIVQKVDLVRPDYYQTELDFQQQIQKESNTAHLKTKLTLTYLANTKEIQIYFPTNITKGELKFFRPSNQDLDQKITLNPQNEGILTLPTQTLSKGFWKVQINWTDGQKEYFSEKELSL